jgi:hypothetical protein
MRLKSTMLDLPSSWDVKLYLHNEFVKYMKELKVSIMVSHASLFKQKERLTYTNRYLLGRYPLLRMHGQLTRQRWAFSALWCIGSKLAKMGSGR